MRTDFNIKGIFNGRKKRFNELKELTELQGTSGFEEDIRSYLRTAITPLVDDVQQDGLGGIFGLRQADESKPRDGCSSYG